MPKKFTLSLMILLMLCGISHADFIYMTSSGSLGSIKVTTSSDIKAPSLQYTGNFSSPFLTSYWDSSATNIMVIDRNATVSGDRAYIFRPNNLAECVTSADIEGVYGTEKAAYSENGYSLFLGAGENIYDVSTSAFRVLHSFDCERVISDDDYETEILTLMADSSYVHALASAGNRQKYMRFDGQIKTGVDVFLSADVSADTSCMVTESNGRPVVGHASGVNVMMSNLRFYRALSTDLPVKAMCRDSSGGLIYATQKASGDTYINSLNHYGEIARYLGVMIESPSPEITIIRDNQRSEVFAVSAGGKIVVFSQRNGYANVRANYGASELGGTPAGIVAAAVSGYNANSSSSGCDSLYAGMIMLAALPFVIRRK